jgi:ribosomal protein S18 acetylase RimI-like enzyme
MSPRVEIVRAEPADAEEILVLQRLAYEVEARLYDDWRLPPMTQTVEELRQEFEDMVILKACADGVIIGSVRGRQTEGSCYVGRIMVHPDHRRRGLATRLMLELEEYFPGVTRFHLFTGSKSAGNITLYLSLGYVAVGEESYSPHIGIILMEKLRSGGLPPGAPGASDAPVQ